MKDFMYSIRKLFIKFITNNISFFCIWLMLFGCIAAFIFSRYQYFLNERLEIANDPNQLVKCGIFFDFHDELILYSSRGGVKPDKYFLLRTVDSKNIYFDYYPQDLRRLGLDKKKLPMYANICVYYSAADAEHRLTPIISKLVIKP